MLRESSSAYGYDFDMAAIADRTLDAGIPGNRAILDLVDSVFTGVGMPDARQTMIDELGPEAFVDACAVYGNFSMMNRVAEGTGIPVPSAAVEREASIVEALDLTRMLKE
jgi:hypothetical protein